MCARSQARRWQGKVAAGLCCVTAFSKWKAAATFNSNWQKGGIQELSCFFFLCFFFIRLYEKNLQHSFSRRYSPTSWFVSTTLEVTIFLHRKPTCSISTFTNEFVCVKVTALDWSDCIKISTFDWSTNKPNYYDN